MPGEAEGASSAQNPAVIASGEPPDLTNRLEHTPITVSARALLRNDQVPATPISGAAINVSVQDEILLKDSYLRRQVALAIVATFVIVNIMVLCGVAWMFKAEMDGIIAKTYTVDHRVVTGELLMTIIGATTVQLGALTILMGKYVFPASR